MSWRGAALAFIAGLMSWPVLAADGREWLAQMNTALAKTSYSGEFVCESAGRSERLRILHRVRNGVVDERLSSLSGGGRELVRRGEEVVVYLPDQKLAVIERRPEGGDLLGSLPPFKGDLADWYEVSVAGREEALLGPATVVVIRPRDGYRFGYRVWIDEHSGLPVRSELSDPAGRVIERLRFTSLQTQVQLADAAFEPAIDRASLRWVRQAQQQASIAPGWQAGQVPPGFQLSLSGTQVMGGARGPVRHLIYSDGLASVSVFIRPAERGPAPRPGAGRMGVTSAFSTTVAGHEVTAVGEVPPDTLRVIANGLRPAQE